MVIGLMSAMPEELERALHELPHAPLARTTVGERTYFTGQICGHQCVAAFSRWGKVAAAVTATELISRFDARSIVFTGVAGGLQAGLRVGDIVVADRLYQHDMDARPLFARFEIPLSGRSFFETDAPLRNRIVEASHAFIAHDPQLPHPRPPRVVVGTIVSGDRFIASSADALSLLDALPGAVCVEMEGAAVAQVCAEYAVPFGVFRVISDTADEHAPGSFQSFVTDVASRYTLGILSRLLRDWPSA